MSLFYSVYLWAGLRLAVFQKVAGLAVQNLTEFGKGADADGTGLAGFENGHIGRGNANALGQLIQAHLAFGQHDIYVENDFTFHSYPSLHCQVALLLEISGLFNQVRQADGGDGDGHTDGADQQGDQYNAGMIHIQEQEHNISDEVIQGDTGNKPGDDLQQTGIFQGEGLILPDITGDPPAEEQHRIAGNGSDPEKDQPGPVPGGKFREAGVKRFTAGGKNEEIYDQAADANDGENDLQVNE